MASCMPAAVKMVLCACGRTQSAAHMACGNAFSLTTYLARLPSTMVEIILSSRLKYRQLFPSCRYLCVGVPWILKVTYLLELFYIVCLFHYIFVHENISYSCFDLISLYWLSAFIKPFLVILHDALYIQGAPKKVTPLGKIRYLLTCSIYIYQIYGVYSWGFSPHILQILLK